MAGGRVTAHSRGGERESSLPHSQGSGGGVRADPPPLSSCHSGAHQCHLKGPCRDMSLVKFRARGRCKLASFPLPFYILEWSILNFMKSSDITVTVGWHARNCIAVHTYSIKKHSFEDTKYSEDIRKRWAAPPDQNGLGQKAGEMRTDARTHARRSSRRVRDFLYFFWSRLSLPSNPPTRASLPPLVLLLPAPCSAPLPV
jgi:hypothetical protein